MLIGRHHLPDNSAAAADSASAALAAATVVNDEGGSTCATSMLSGGARHCEVNDFCGESAADEAIASLLRFADKEIAPLLQLDSSI